MNMYDWVYMAAYVFYKRLFGRSFSGRVGTFMTGLCALLMINLFMLTNLLKGSLRIASVWFVLILSFASFIYETIYIIKNFDLIPQRYALLPAEKRHIPIFFAGLFIIILIIGTIVNLLFVSIYST